MRLGNDLAAIILVDVVRKMPSAWLVVGPAHTLKNLDLSELSRSKVKTILCCRALQCHLLRAITAATLPSVFAYTGWSNS